MDYGNTLSGKLSELVIEEDYRAEDVRFDPSAERMENQLASEEAKPGGKNGKLALRASRGKEDKAATCSESLIGPPDGFYFIFPYVDLPSLLILERVSKPVWSGVNDVLYDYFTGKHGDYTYRLGETQTRFVFAIFFSGSHPPTRTLAKDEGLSNSIDLILDRDRSTSKSGNFLALAKAPCSSDLD
ncbi:hypothetical protein R1flu_028855 [Riccia fluitans]|uniref:Uncharacterized protein n=1 Tax=Riccia fluitans TaxID=41844 RepID=A0ABD1XMU5_9MARC